MPKGKNASVDSTEITKDNLRWSEAMDIALLNALIEEAGKGNRHDGSWTTEAYANVVELLRTTVSPRITKNHVKIRMKTLKEHFAEAFDLFNSLSGFSWNPTTKRFEAEEEVWEDFIKDKPQAARWKKMQIKHYDMLKELFGADRATGRNACTAKEKVTMWNRQKETIDLNDCFQDVGLQDPDFSMFDDIPVASPEHDTFSPTTGQVNQSIGTTSISSSRGTKRKAQMLELLESHFDKVQAGINAMADAVKEGNKASDRLVVVTEKQIQLGEKQIQLGEKQIQIAEKGLAIIEQSRPRHYTEADIWNTLSEMGIHQQLRLQCYRFLCTNDQQKKEFFGLPAEVRLDVLLQMLSEAGIM